MHKKQFTVTGMRLDLASKALIMVHGRGGSARDILTLVDDLDVVEFAVLAPDAANNSWYPYSFLSPPSLNEPWLSSSLDLLNEITNDLIGKGFETENIYYLGFSQGACLTLEYVTRHANKFGGVVAFTGGLIGDKIYMENYGGDFSGTPILLGSSDPDPHVPVERVNSSAEILTGMNARVTKNIYKNMGHTISRDEIKLANDLIFNPVGKS
jgi:phospholipase/carboxylesterase